MRKALKQALRDLDGEFAGAIDNRFLRRRPLARDRRFCFAVELGDLLGRLREQILLFALRRQSCASAISLSPFCGDLRARLVGVGTKIGGLLAGFEPRRPAACSPPAAA